MKCCDKCKGRYDCDRKCAKYFEEERQMYGVKPKFEVKVNI